ncbi:MAG: hypothetical protein JSR17_10375 [Proteobacteria bacterium]|nr:hypothetical protein [Pseudomonadota bacterium]
MQSSGPKLLLTARTFKMQQVHGTDTSERHENKDWTRLSSEIDWVGNRNNLWVSNGCSLNREKLLFDSKSELIQELKARVVERCKGKSIEETLLIVNESINNLNNMDGKSYEEIEETVDRRLDIYIGQQMMNQLTSTSPMITMESLIEEKLLVCRHKGLLAASLIAHLVEEGILPFGNVRQYRSDLAFGHYKNGAHSWSVYRNHETGEIWICDPRNQAVFLLPKDTVNAEYLLGNTTIEDMITRLDELDGLRPFMNGLKRFKGSPIEEVTYQSGNLTTQHLRIKCNSNQKGFEAFIKALTEQNIVFEIENGPQPIVLVKAHNNPKLFAADMEKLTDDYKTYTGRKGIKLERINGYRNLCDYAGITLAFANENLDIGLASSLQSKSDGSVIQEVVKAINMKHLMMVYRGTSDNREKWINWLFYKLAEISMNDKLDVPTKNAKVEELLQEMQAQANVDAKGKIAAQFAEQVLNEIAELKPTAKIALAR